MRRRSRKAERRKGGRGINKQKNLVIVTKEKKRISMFALLSFFCTANHDRWHWDPSPCASPCLFADARTMSPLVSIHFFASISHVRPNIFIQVKVVCA